MNLRMACHTLNEGRITVFWLVVTFALFFTILFACVGMVVDAYR